MLRSALSVVAAVLGVAAQSPSLVCRLSLSHGDSTHARGISAYAVNPDMQTAVVLRTARRDGPGYDQAKIGVSQAELALIDLQDGKALAVGPQLLSPFPVSLAISANGRTVVVVRKLDDAMYKPYGISVWKPYSEPQNLHDYRFATASGEHPFGSFAGSPPVISPDGKRVAAFVHQFGNGDDEPDERGDNAIGLLELETGDVTVMQLPASVGAPVGPDQLWHLGWSSDGSWLYAVLHGSYSEERHGEFVAGKPAPLYPRPDLTLYRFSLATKTATRVGSVPPTTCGFGPDDNLVVADTIREGWGPHRAFGLLPIAQVAEESSRGGATGMTPVTGLKMQTVVRRDDPAFTTFRKVFVGRTHIFAEVEGKGANGCAALVERVPAAGHQKE